MDVGCGVRERLHDLLRPRYVLQVRVISSHSFIILLIFFIFIIRTAEFVYDDFISKPWTHTHFQDIYCSNSYRSHASSSEHCFMSTDPSFFLNFFTLP